MREILTAGIVVTALCGVPALAADMPVKAPMIAAAPMFNWSGLYAGVNAGYGWGESRWQNPAPTSDTGDFRIRGGLVGGTVGVNWQSGNWIFGIEGDFDWSGVKGTTGSNCVACTTDGRWLSTIRGRLGYAVDRTLWYITGGGAFGGVRNDLHQAGFTPSTSTQSGGTIGAGVEYAFAPNWSAKIEYLFVELNDRKCPFTTCGEVNTRVKFDENIVRAGLNWKFDWGKAPVVAKY